MIDRILALVDRLTAFIETIPKKITNNLGNIILIGTLLVGVPRYAAAFAQAEPTFMGVTIAPITGLGFGLLIEVGIYYVVDSWFDARRRGLKLSWLLLLGFVIQLVIAPFVIAPAIVGHMTANPGELAKVLTWRPGLWLWAIIVAASPELLLAAAAAASFMRQKAGKKKDDSEEKPTKSKKAARPPSFACDVCGAVAGKSGKPFGSRAAVNAHQREHAGSNGRELETAANEPAVEII